MSTSGPSPETDPQTRPSDGLGSAEDPGESTQMNKASQGEDVPPTEKQAPNESYNESERQDSSEKKSVKTGNSFTGNEEENEEVIEPCFPLRYLVVCLMAIGMVLINAMRTNVGFTVMTILDQKAHEKVGTLEAMINLPDVKWNTRMIGFLHSVFYMGYLVTHLPAGYLATKLPCHRLYGGSILLSCSLNLLLPVAIEKISFEFTCIVRFLQGLSEGLLYPACYGILRHWSTPLERGRLGSAVLTGAYAGAVIGFPLAGLITHFIGWQYVYYANGGAGVVWMLFWLLLSTEKPSHHRLITDAELTYLEKAQGQHVVDFQESWLPWKRIMTSPAVISLCTCHFARNWVFILMLTNEPFYLSLFNLSIAENGLYSSLPHVCKVCLAFVSGYIADFLLIRYHVDTGTVRKLLTGSAFGTQATGFLILSFLSQKVPVIIFLTIAVGSYGLSVSGWQINHYDLSTRHASFLVAVTSTIGVLGAIMAPLVAGELTINQDLKGWYNVFYITVVIAAVALFSFLIFGSGEEQSWATPPEHIRLIQKSDPLSKRPYKTFTIQGSKRPMEVPDAIPLEDTGTSKTESATKSKSEKQS